MVKEEEKSLASVPTDLKMTSVIKAPPSRGPQTSATPRPVAVPAFANAIERLLTLIQPADFYFTKSSTSCITSSGKPFFPRLRLGVPRLDSHRT